MVGVTGLEPATSRPPAVRATNCATPRYLVSLAHYIIKPHAHCCYLLAGIVQRWAGLASQSLICRPAPLTIPLAALAIARHRLELGLNKLPSLRCTQSWPGLVLHSRDQTVVPLAVALLAASMHRPSVMTVATVVSGRGR